MQQMPGYPSFDGLDDPYDLSEYGIPSTPDLFAELFPPTRRLVIKHDDEALDGDMNLRVDVGEFSKSSRPITLFHLRMHDLASREFSLRRYARDCGREVISRRRHYEERSRKIIGLDDTKAPRRGPLIKDRHHHPTTPRSRKYLPGIVNGIPVHAIPDTGSTRNIISAAFARKHGFPIYHPPDASTFQFANRAMAAAAGQVLLHWSFADSPATTHPIPFTVLEGFAHDVAIGYPFLRKTQTMSTNSHRLRDRGPIDVDDRRLYAVNSVGDPTQRLRGTLNGFVTTALPDSGSERNVIDKNFAESRGLTIDPTEKIWLRFGDGSVRRTTGQVRAHWGMSSDHRKGFEVVFDVLEDCAYDVILGDELLYETDVFGQWSQCLEDVWEEENEWEMFCLISVFAGCFRGAKGGSGGLDDNERVDWIRKSTAETQYRIEAESVLGPDRNSPAWRDELMRRERWVLENPPPLPEPASRMVRVSRSRSSPIRRVVPPFHGAGSAPIPLRPIRGGRAPRCAVTVLT